MFVFLLKDVRLFRKHEHAFFHPFRRLKQFIGKKKGIYKDFVRFAVINPQKTPHSMDKNGIRASLLLFVATILAAVIANSPLAPVYESFLTQELHLRVGDFNLFSHDGHPLSMLEFINDCLMTIFFFAVGLEIKREVLVGELSSFRKAILPFISACGGMLLPVILYVCVVAFHSPEIQGMAIPMATDIAFSLGILNLFGRRVPLSLKIFLTAFAVVDDIGGILVIALCYSTEIHYSYLIIAGILLAFVYYMGKRGVSRKLFFMFFGAVIWYMFLQSGIHSTLSGVLLAFTIPARPSLNAGKYIKRIRIAITHFPLSTSDNIILTKEQIDVLKKVERTSNRVISPLQSLENDLHGAINYIILPLFAFANAGIMFSGESSVIGSVSIAITIGLLVGKFLGIFLFTWIAIKTRTAVMPEGMTWKNIAGISLLGGIGFTVSLFIANLSFGGEHIALLNQAKFGVICGTILSAILGCIVLNRVLPQVKR